MRLKPEDKPIFKKSWSAPCALQNALDYELRCLQQQGIIELVNSSPWAKANGRLRVYGDYKVTINQCVEKKVYPQLTVEDLFTQISGGQVFSKLDLSQVYQQLPLDENSKNLLVVNTTSGLYCYYIQDCRVRCLLHRQSSNQ